MVETQLLPLAEEQFWPLGFSQGVGEGTEQSIGERIGPAFKSDERDSW